jgi:hypothetical protein
LKRLSGLVCWGTLLGLLPLACVYDDAQRCGPHQTLISNDRCTCDPGYVPAVEGCVPCGDHEQEANGECTCVEGYARPADAAACEPIPEALGADCDTESAPCTNAAYPLCQVTAGTHGYCTKACAGSDDCDGGYKCHAVGDNGYCRRPPTGYGASCSSDDDCAGNEASFCEQLQKHVCLVPCSAGHTDVCFEGESCCDFVLFAPICVPAAACTDNGGTALR